MATLSANSRRNSSSPTSPSSPRPSIGNESLPNEISKPLLQTLNEEDIVPEPIPLPPPPPSGLKTITTKSMDFSEMTNQNSGKMPKEKEFTERSDSGFSDCSNGSNGNAIQAPHISPNVALIHPLFNKINSISEEKPINESNQLENSSNKVKELGSTVSVNMLKMKLEKMADAQQNTIKNFDANKKLVKRLSNRVEAAFKDKKGSAEFLMMDDLDSFRELDNEPRSLPIQQATKTLVRSASLYQKRIVDKEPIMKSDFTNTIKMRKKSLESSASREKQIYPQRILLEPSGKVSKLLQRFDSQNATTNGWDSDTTSVTEPIVQTPGIDDSFKGMTLHESNKTDDEIIEILDTKKAIVAATGTQKSPAFIISTTARKSPTKIAKKTTVSSSGSGSMKRVIASKLSTNTKTYITSMEAKIISQRKSPTKLTNETPINRATSKLISNQTNHPNSLKKFHHKSTASTADAGAIQHASRSATVSTTTANKATAYSSFNRTSPVRLSGRVKEVTNRLSTSKAIVKATSPVRHDSHKKSTAKFTKAHDIIQEHNNDNMTIKSISGKVITVAEAIIETEQRVEHTINGKVDGTFTLKSKMNENFRKASAFWKAT